MYLVVDRPNNNLFIAETLQAAFYYTVDHQDGRIIEISLLDLKRYFGEIPMFKEYLARKKRQDKRIAQGHRNGRPKKHRLIRE